MEIKHFKGGRASSKYGQTNDVLKIKDRTPLLMFHDTFDFAQRSNLIGNKKTSFK